VEGAEVLRSGEDPCNVEVSKNLTFEASPLFTVTIATISPFELSAPNIVNITLKTSFPLPVSACAGLVTKTETNTDVNTNAKSTGDTTKLFSLDFSSDTIYYSARP
jgi:hypothetical protein